MTLADYVHTFGQDLLRRHGQRVHKLALNAGFTCPNRDGVRGRGGCTFCNNASFNPSTHSVPSLREQIAAGAAVVRRRTGAMRFLAYFQAYTNTYGDIARLAALYDEALRQPGVVGLSVGTRPDCVGPEVADLLVSLRDRGYEVWLELGLQSAFDDTLARVNRGHGLAEYRKALQLAQERDLPVCTHLIIGLPGEGPDRALSSLDRVLDLGVEGLKIHPLHVVRHTQLAWEWRRGHYRAWTMEEYVSTAADLIERTPSDIRFHRLTGTAAKDILLAPVWCSRKWAVLNAIEAELRRRGTRQGRLAAAGQPYPLPYRLIG